MMKRVLGKLFGAREKLARDRGHHDKEMPFLEHLEELRQMLVKVIATLIIFMIGAFVFREPLFDSLKRPIELAGLGASIDMPPDVAKLDWLKVQTLSKTATSLDKTYREDFITAALGEKEKHLRLYVEALPFFNATLVLPKEARESFVNKAITDNVPLRDTVLKLVEKNPNAKVGRQGNLIEMSALKPPEAFMLSLKISLLAGIILAFPLLLYFFAQFVFPGLTGKEKKAVIPAVGVGFLLFLFGASFAYWIVTPRVLEFFHSYAEELGIQSDYRIGYYVSFVSQLVLIFGLAFELPVVVLTLVKLELLGYSFMAKNRSHAVVIIFVVAAIITPTPDAPTLCLLAVPMVILYEFCIWMAFFMDRKRRRLEAEEEAERAVRAKKRAAAREISVPGALPVGTVGQSEPDRTTTDESALADFEANDALAEGDGVPEYEDGFGPDSGEDEKSDDAGDPYSGYEFHNGPYEDANEEPKKPDSVDDTPSSEQEGGEDSDHSNEDSSSSKH
ncbi:MAG: twin-arginine translocase subunit TatC [Verrucomicrobiaceae bacterium]|nr:twin-arginine translocase subunit TatC [Verrucomicrobiaceae bacterium]